MNSQISRYEKANYQNCIYAMQEPSWSLYGWWCTFGIDLNTIPRSIDWGYDYVEFRVKCFQTEPDCWCENFKAPATDTTLELERVLA